MIKASSTSEDFIRTTKLKPAKQSKNNKGRQQAAVLFSFLERRTRLKNKKRSLAGAQVGGVMLRSTGGSSRFRTFGLFSVFIFSKIALFKRQACYKRSGCSACPFAKRRIVSVAFLSCADIIYFYYFIFFLGGESLLLSVSLRELFGAVLSWRSFHLTRRSRTGLG